MVVCEMCKCPQANALWPWDGPEEAGAEVDGSSQMFAQTFTYSHTPIRPAPLGEY